MKLVFSLLITLSAGAIAGIATAQNIDTWYVVLNKPWFNPPNWVFAPVWTILYIMMAIALSAIWKLPSSKRRNTALSIFFVQLLLNFFWSFIFFHFHRVAVALADIILLWATILLCILSFSKLNKRAAWLMVPYISWVSFAMVLNISILYLNVK